VWVVVFGGGFFEEGDGEVRRRKREEGRGKREEVRSEK
jgi:hypothetical protein